MGIRQKTVAFLLIFFVALVSINKTFYTHSHVLDNGSVVTHAHPYNKDADDSPIKSHHHNQAELIIFSIYSIVTPEEFIFTTPILEKKNTFYSKPLSTYHSVCWRFIKGRAPPLV